jgi:hypothetical protein
MKLFVLPKGRYYVGEPCYVVPDNLWSQVCDLFIYDKIERKAGDFQTSYPAPDSRDGQIIKYKDIPFFVCGTAYGDGCYPVKQNGKTLAHLGVDAGLLSIIPSELVKQWGKQADAERLGFSVNISHDFSIKAEGGNFKFAGYSVETGDEND